MRRTWISVPPRGPCRRAAPGRHPGQRLGHGALDVLDAIEQSCDVFFYNVGKELGIDRIATYTKAMGLGRRTGIDLSDFVREVVDIPQVGVNSMFVGGDTGPTHLAAAVGTPEDGAVLDGVVQEIDLQTGLVAMEFQDAGFRDSRLMRLNVLQRAMDAGRLRPDLRWQAAPPLDGRDASTLARPTAAA